MASEDTSLKPQIGGKRGKYYTDRERVKAIWPTQPQCPHCGDTLMVRVIAVNNTPYDHVDIRVECPTCDDAYLFGIPQDKSSGMAIHIFDSNPDVATIFRKLGDRKCPFKHGVMKPTKVFGDWRPNKENLELQWKCPQCYVTRHEVIERHVPSIGESGLTEEEEAAFYEKLKKMGYVE